VSFVIHAVVLLAIAGLAAYEPSLSPRSIDEAIAVGLTRIEAERARFQRPYRVVVNAPPVDWVDVVTPFRRIALEADSRVRTGARLFGQREAIALLGSTPEQVDVIVELSFHPLNTFVGVPAYDVRLMRGAVTVQPRELERLPRFGPRVGDPTLPYPWSTGNSIRIAPGTEPLLGGRLIAHFDGRLLSADAMYEVVVLDGDGKQLARAGVNFASFR
jgi:hypothetical protein